MSGAITQFVFGREVMITSTPRPGTMLAGRVLVSLIFLSSGVGKIGAWDETVAMMTAEGMVAVPAFLVLAIVCELGGSLSVLTGTLTRLGALVLLVFLIPATLVFHDFWVYEGAARADQMIHFSKNVTIMGGLLLLIGAGPGRYSVDSRLEPRMRRAA